MLFVVTVFMWLSDENSNESHKLESMYCSRLKCNTKFMMMGDLSPFDLRVLHLLEHF